TRSWRHLQKMVVFPYEELKELLGLAFDHCEIVANALSVPVSWVLMAEISTVLHEGRQRVRRCVHAVQGPDMVGQPTMKGRPRDAQTGLTQLLGPHEAGTFSNGPEELLRMHGPADSNVGSINKNRGAILGADSYANNFSKRTATVKNSNKQPSLPASFTVTLSQTMRSVSCVINPWWPPDCSASHCINTPPSAMKAAARDRFCASDMRPITPSIEPEEKPMWNSPGGVYRGRLMSGRSPGFSFPSACC
ncbi:unnamed protein product, partial [Symbiodinium pilosum]